MNETNVEFFIQKMSDDQKNLALSILRKWEREKAEKAAEFIILTDMEKAMADNRLIMKQTSIKYLVALPTFKGDKGFNHQTILVSAKNLNDCVSLVRHLRPNSNIGDIQKVNY